MSLRKQLSSWLSSHSQKTDAPSLPRTQREWESLFARSFTPQERDQWIDLIARAIRSKESRYFIADCAERTLFIFEEVFPHEKRLREALRLRRLRADKQITEQEWLDARDAAQAAIDDAAPKDENGPLPISSWTNEQRAALSAASIHLLSSDQAEDAALFAAVAMSHHSKDPKGAFDKERDWQLPRLFRAIRALTNS